MKKEESESFLIAICFRIMALSINDSLYSCLFFFLTGLHFFHLIIGLLLLSLLFWSCSFSYSTTTPNEREDRKKKSQTKMRDESCNPMASAYKLPLIPLPAVDK